MFSSAKKKLFPIVPLSIALLLIGSNAWALPSFLTTFNNTYGTAGTRLDTCGTCHFDFNGGGPLTPYGADTTEGADPDGDLATSLDEINALFMPGYSCSNYTQAVNAPADLADYVDAANVGCVPLVATTVEAAVLPTSRSVQVGTPAAAFGTIINSGTADATGCGIELVTPVTADFAYQTTDPLTNALTGTPNTPVNIAAGEAQSYVFALTPTAEITPTDVELAFGCTDAGPATSTVGLNTLLLSASTNPVPDIVALSATQSGNGTVELPGDAGVNAFAVASVNVGSDGSITVSADTGGVNVPVQLTICQTDPATSGCFATPDTSVTTTIAAGTTPTFAIFVQGTGNVTNDPAANRIFVRFQDAGVTRGSTSVAVQTVTP